MRTTLLGSLACGFRTPRPGNRTLLTMVLGIGLCPAALGQLAPLEAEAGVATLAATPPPLPEDVAALTQPWSSIRSLQLELETEADADGQPARIELVMTSDKRFAQRTWAKQPDATDWPTQPTYFAFCDHQHLKARRGTLDMYLRHDASVAWLPPPGPTQLLLAPWATLRSALTHTPNITTSRDETGTRVMVSHDGATVNPAHTLTFDESGTLTAWSAIGGTTIRYRGISFVTGDDGIRPQLATDAAIVQTNARSNSAKGEQTAGTEVVWRVTSLRLNPQDLDARLDFAPFAQQYSRFDPDTGDIIRPDGSSGGREIQPAVRAIELWEANKKTSAWSAVFKWGSIATGLFLLGGMMELIRRRL